MSKTYVQYGGGLSAPDGWLNFDVSPTLRIQKIPLLGILLRKQLNVVFPDNVRYGDIVKGLPVADNSCDGIYCSHVLEHLSLGDFRKALVNTHKILKPGGIFRCIVPDLSWHMREYMLAIDQREDKHASELESASIKFLKTTHLGTEVRPRGFLGLLRSFIGNTRHLWMWDIHSLTRELIDQGFKDIITFQYNDCEDDMFLTIEDSERFIKAVALQCRK